MMIKFLDLKELNDRYEERFLEDLQSMLRSATYINGQKLAQFEHNFSNFVGSSDTIGVGNGLDALRLIFRALKQQKKIIGFQCQTT